jgi:hypothetical protein
MSFLQSCAVLPLSRVLSFLPVVCCPSSQLCAVLPLSRVLSFLQSCAVLPLVVCCPSSSRVLSFLTVVCCPSSQLCAVLPPVVCCPSFSRVLSFLSVMCRPSSQSCAVLPHSRVLSFLSVMCCPSSKTVTVPAQLSTPPLQYDREGSWEGIGDILTAMTVHPSHSRPPCQPCNVHPPAWSIPAVC